MEEPGVKPECGWVAGVDGCRAGWLVAMLAPVDAGIRFHLLERFAEIASLPERAAIIAVDMPIGLPEHIGAYGRGPERLVRRLLGERQSAVFSVPSRAAVYATDYRDACRIAAHTSDPPKKVSRQLFGIAPKICELDAFLRGPSPRAPLYEVHPEVAFWRLNGERALAEPKKRKGQPYEPSLALRRALLAGEGLKTQAAPPKGAAADDVLDAIACAAIARRIGLGVARPFPDPPLRDAFGLPIAIWA